MRERASSKSAAQFSLEHNTLKNLPRSINPSTTFFDDSAHHWWTLAKRSNDGAQTITWEQFKTLFLGQYFNHSHHSRIQSNFLNMKKRDDEGVIEFEQRFTTLSYHVPYLVPDERTRINMFIGALGGVYVDKMWFQSGPSKKAASLSASGSLAGSGSSGGSGFGPQSRTRGNFRRPFRTS
ncbi:hypothetical protein ACLB2K_002305 [Fragaria x ananassa]